MTTSEFLQLQTVLFNSLANIRTIPANELLRKLAEIEKDGGLIDHNLQPVSVNTEQVRKVLAASMQFIQLVDWEPYRMHSTDIYRLECMCGKRIDSPSPSAKCDSCGREIRVEWQAILPKKPVDQEKGAA